MARSRLKEMIGLRVAKGRDSQSTYQYADLEEKDSIRILKLDARNVGKSSGPTGQLIVTRLSAHPGYEALSYTWGDPTFSEALFLNEGVVGTTKSLSGALSHLAFPDRPRYIWADSVCINQANADERSTQVAIMGDIYRQAERVLVWLGPGNENTAKVFSFFRQISARSEDYGINLRDIKIDQRPWERPVTNPDHRHALDNIPTEYDITGIDEFYSNPWFTRLWVVQEVALAREITLCCGPHEIPWQHFLAAASMKVKCVNHSTPSNLRLPYGFPGALTVFDACAKYKGVRHVNLLNALVALRHKQCSNDSDRIYAMLSQAGPLDPKIVPDYKKSVRELYVATAEALLPLQTQTLGLAGLAPRWTAPTAKLSSQKKGPDADERESSRLRSMCNELPS